VNFVWEYGILPHVDNKKTWEVNGTTNGTTSNGLKKKN
jgi:hypothetical protein